MTWHYIKILPFGENGELKLNSVNQTKHDQTIQKCNTLCYEYYANLFIDTVQFSVVTTQITHNVFIKFVFSIVKMLKENILKTFS